MKRTVGILVSIILGCGTFFFCNKHPKDVPQTAVKNDTINLVHNDAANKELWRAVLSNDTVSAKAAIAIGADPNYTPEPGKSLFCFAFDSLFVNMAEMLVRHGVELRDIKCNNRYVIDEIHYWLRGNAESNQFVKFLGFKKLWLKYNGLQSWDSSSFKKHSIIISNYYDKSGARHFVWLSLEPPYTKEIFPCDNIDNQDCRAGLEEVNGDTVKISCIVCKDDCIGIEFEFEDPEEPGAEKPTDIPGCCYTKSIAMYDRMGNHLKTYYPKKRVGWYR
jgi:hypothetical protein